MMESAIGVPDADTDVPLGAFVVDDICIESVHEMEHRAALPSGPWTFGPGSL